MALPRQTAMSDNLRRLCLVRLIALAAMIISMAMARVYELDLYYRPLLGILALLTILNIGAWLRSNRSWPITEIEFLGHILSDILGLALLLYFSGGATNPFISYFLVPLSISAATLPWGFTWLVAVLCIGFYSLLLVYHIPVEVFSLHNHDAPRLNLHFLGMWANFSLSALLITYFVVGMAQALRSREQMLNQLREEGLRNEQIMAVATLAAGTAHELGTPLSTMRILLDEMRRDGIHHSHSTEDLEILSEQLDACRSTLKNLISTADRSQSGQAGRFRADTYFEELVRDWHLLHPEITLQLQIHPATKSLYINADVTLKQALINLLDNASKASPSGIEVSVESEENMLMLEILDDGPGIPDTIAEKIGKPIIINSDSGLGIGLLLTHATLTKFGGSVVLYPRQSGGTRTEVKLPVHKARS